jgi:formate dehydrogenase gamma subunit
MSTLKTYMRFPVSQRIEHLLLLLSFTILAVTGLPQKFPTNAVSAAIVSVLGGIELVRIIHRVAATVFLIETIYHVILIGYKLYVKRLEATMLPGVKDAKDAIQAFGYNFGVTKNHPKMGRYSFAEKAEYWALIWGGAVMAITGFMLWNPIATAAILPGQFIPAAKAAHGGEAILAVLAIIVWHFYGVHIKTWNWSMIKGTLTHHEMEDEHALELEAIEDGTIKTRHAVVENKKRRTIYFPIAAVLTLVLIFGVYWFVTLETSAITTIPPVDENLQIYSPRTPTPTVAKPTPTPTVEPAQPSESDESSSESAESAQPTQPAQASSGSSSAQTWDASVGALFKQKCGACHGTSGGLSVASYADLMKGGAAGAVIKPGDPDASALVILQAKGGHMGQFSAEELTLVKEWIKAGALEK